MYIFIYFYLTIVTNIPPVYIQMKIHGFYLHTSSRAPMSASDNKSNDEAQKTMKILLLHSLKWNKTHCAPAAASCHQLSSFGHRLFISPFPS